MTYARKQTSDYFNLASQKGVRFTGGSAPQNVDISTDWRCARCGREMNKSYRYLKSQKAGCRCYANAKEDEQRYRDVAAELGIEWVYDPANDYFPMNTKTPTSWRGPSGKLVDAPLHELAYKTSRNAKWFRELGLE